MIRRRPGAAVFFGISNIIVGALGLLYYGCSGLVSMAMFSDRSTSIWDYLANNLRIFAPMTIAHVIVSLLLCVVLMISGIGLLNMRNWGRLTSLATAVLALLLNVWSFIFQMTVVGPALQRYIDSAPDHFERGQSIVQVVMLSYLTYGGATMASLYSIIMLIMLSLPEVASAFRGHARPAWADKLNDFDDFDDRPRRRRPRRYDDDWDD
jgi:hypothetical protein